jgi:phenylpyruvate tautomerase PptA (4-oxalocrotonate tautomerase family)
VPVVTIDYVAARGETLPHGLAQSLADAIGDAVGATPGRAWVRIRVVPRDQYAESATASDETPLPVFVTLLRKQLPPDAALASQAAAVTDAVARVTGRPADCVHVEFAPPMAGRMALGGTLVR